MRREGASEESHDPPGHKAIINRHMHPLKRFVNLSRRHRLAFPGTQQAFDEVRTKLGMQLHRQSVLTISEDPEGAEVIATEQLGTGGKPRHLILMAGL